MATIRNTKDVFLQAASPRQIVVTVPSTNVTGQIDGTSATTVKNNASTGAAHAATTGNPHNVNFSQIAGDLDSIANGVTYFKTTANQVTGGGRAFSALDSSNEYVKSLLSTKLTVVGSNPSTGWVGDVNGIRMYQSGTLKVNIPVSGAPSFSGDITGGSNIDISGTAKFQGATNTGGVNYCGVFNEARTVTGGISATAGSTGFGVRGSAGTNGSIGVSGTGGSSSGAEGVRATQGSAGGVALNVVGPMSISSTVVVSNLNADMVDGYHASALCNLVTTNTGTCTVSGNGFQNLITGTLAGTVRTRGTSNIVYIENISDARLKQDIEDEELGLEFILSLRPRSYRMKSNPDLVSHGFIYQEVAKLVSDSDSLATLNPDGIGAFDYNGITSPIVKAIQQIHQDLCIIKHHLKEISNG